MMSSFSNHPLDGTYRQPSIPRSCTNPFIPTGHQSKASASPECSAVPLGVPQLPPLPALPDALAPKPDAKPTYDAPAFVLTGDAAKAMEEMQKAENALLTHLGTEEATERKIHQKRLDYEAGFHKQRIDDENSYYLLRSASDAVKRTLAETLTGSFHRQIEALQDQYARDLLAHTQQHERDAKELEVLRTQAEMADSERKGWKLERTALTRKIVQVEEEKETVVLEMGRQRAAIDRARARTAELKAETCREEEEIERSLLQDLDGEPIVDGPPLALTEATAATKTRFIGPIFVDKSTSPPPSKSGSPSSSDGAASSATHSTTSSPSHKRSSPSTSPEPSSGSPGKKQRTSGMAIGPYMDQTRPGTA